MMCDLGIRGQRWRNTRIAGGMNTLTGISKKVNPMSIVHHVSGLKTWKGKGILYQVSPLISKWSSWPLKFINIPNVEPDLAVT